MSIHDQFHRPLRDLRISLIDRCNFRCPYCMPSKQFDHNYVFLNKEEWLTFDEIVRLATIFVSLGVTKLRLTGGEPLLRPQLDQLIARLAMIKGVDDLALTTNGSFLMSMAADLKKAGLKRLTVSLDSVDEAIFAQMSGQRGLLDDVLNGIDAALSVGFKGIKINTVIERGVNESSIIDLARFSRDTGLSVRFIEYMDVGNQNNWSRDKVVPAQEMIERINDTYPIEKVKATIDGETSLRYRFLDGKGEIGFIASVTKAFCGTCNRLRLSADGKMYTCLFATHGADLRQIIRTHNDEDRIRHFIQEVWSKREDRYSELRGQKPQTKLDPKVEMYHIGG